MLQRQEKIPRGIPVSSATRQTSKTVAYPRGHAFHRYNRLMWFGFCYRTTWYKQTLLVTRAYEETNRRKELSVRACVCVCVCVCD